MNDSDNRPRNSDEFWERMAYHVVVAHKETKEQPDEDYFAGIYEGFLAGLAELSFYLGKIDDFVSFCERLDEVSLSEDDIEEVSDGS